MSFLRFKASGSRHRLRLLSCDVGGTSFLDYLLILSLVGIFVVIGAYTIGTRVNSGYMSTTHFLIEHTNEATIDVATVVNGESAEIVARAEPGFELMLEDWRQWVDLIVVAPLVLFAIAWLVRRRRKKHQRQEKQRARQRRRAERFGKVIAGTSKSTSTNIEKSQLGQTASSTQSQAANLNLALTDPMANEKIAKVVPIH